jgi:hypothetical protein
LIKQTWGNPFIGCISFGEGPFICSSASFLD